MTAASPPPGPEVPPDPAPRRRGWRYRHGDGLEFDRVTFFSDAVYAIAMTLLIVPIEAPELTEEDGASVSALWHAIRELVPGLFSFFLAFWLLGFFWIAHHGFVASLRAVDAKFIGLNLVYLAFVASLPFPSSLVGKYQENPVSVVMFASSLILVSAMETVLFVHAHRAGLRKTPLTPEYFRAGLIESSVPTVLFLLSIPLAFVSTTIAMLSWLLSVPLGMVVSRLSKIPGDDLKEALSN